MTKKAVRSLSLDVAILGFLAERPASGYDLKTRCFTGPIRAFWTADQAQIYRTLDRLKAARLVSSTRRRQSSRPDRLIYEITHAGREALAERVSQPLPLPPLRDPFLVQLFFSGLVDDEALLQVLETRRAEHQGRLDELRAFQSEVSADRQRLPRDTLLMLTALDGAIAQQRTLIDWLDECIDSVRDGALPGSHEGVGQRHLFGV
jgi:DNA-binding PadR family transcriptional regulator